MPEVKDFVLRGALAGVAAGVVVWLFALVFVEPLIDAAIGYEEGRGAVEEALAGTAAAAEEEVVSRAVQGTVGLGVGSVALGLAIGLIFAVAYTLLHGRVPLRPRALALVTALAGFVAVYLVPFLKYPANPPAVGSDATIGDRAGLYLVLVVGSVAFAAGAAVLAARLRERLGTFSAVLVGIVAYVVLSAVLMSLLPSLGSLTTDVAQDGPRVSETPLPLRDGAGAIVFPGFDPDLLYSFRLYSVAAQALLWAVIGLVFGALVERLTARPGRTEGASEREPASA